MSFLGHPDRTDRTADASHELDLGPGEWDEVERAPADERLGLCTILSFWAIAAMLLVVVVAAPALEAVAHRLH